MSNPPENVTAAQPGHERDQEKERDVVGIVISGAVARGAYEAGALDVLLPALVDQGRRPTVFVGTSAGAINAAGLAQFADEKASEATGKLLDVWREIDERSIWAPPLLTAPGTALRYAAGFVGLGVPVTGILDTSPLRKTAERIFKPERIAKNVDDGHVRAVASAATLCPPDGSNGRTRVFVQSRYDLPPPDPDSGLDFIPTPLRAEHVIASASVPVVFPPTKVTKPNEAAGWYIDGGVRLNTPILPAIKLGVTRLAVVSSHATGYQEPQQGPSGSAPSVEDAIAVALHALLADGMIEDLRNLKRVNSLAKHLIDNGAPPLLADDGHEYRRIPHLVVAPQHRQLADLAREVFRRKYKHWWQPRSLDYRLLDRLLAGGGESPGDDELLSYLLFDRDYFEEQFKLGRDDASAALDAGWQDDDPS